MLKVFKLTIHIMLYVSISVVGLQFNLIDSTTSHLNEYASVNQTHHDNIDDSIDNHLHSHKHSHDGEEHEHSHGPSKISQKEIKVFNGNSYTKITTEEVESIQNFQEKILISNPHLLRLFRPPIS